VTKPTKEFVDQTGRRKVKGNMDIELAVDAMEIAGSIDHMVLFSGDGDFRSLVEAVQRRGVRVTVVSTISMIADELRRQADVFVDIVELQPKIIRTQSARHRVDHGTICGRTCANSGHYKALCACVDRTFVNPNSSRRRPGRARIFLLG
jgi:hypothetical protein